ncbi:hypothetical protein ACDL92_11915 [Ihubacter sp. mB4P-1]|uniref:hypothetical protein n=1 Tax=Ihubacter sp. mB4P-1 TaxID=3242370 RepID=UPI00216DFED9|nr:hypothetical protein [Emergencia sp.]
MAKGFPYRNRIPLEGKVIGFWEVIDYAGCDGKKSWYRCRCGKCGTIKQIRADKLRDGRTKQCADCRAAELNAISLRKKF